MSDDDERSTGRGPGAGRRPTRARRVAGTVGRAGAVGAFGVAMSGLLTGCEVSKTFDSLCTTNPPVPHQNLGTVWADIEVPASVKAGDDFTVRVDSIGGGSVAGTPVPPNYAGTLLVSGAASPSGPVAVGSLLSQTDFPVTLQYTATGQPGDEIDISVTNGSNLWLTIENGVPVGMSTSCTPAVDEGHLVTLHIEEP